LRSFVIPCLVGACVSLVAACGADSSGDDDDNGGESGSGGSGGTSGAGGKGGTGGTGGTGGAGGTGGTSGTGGTGGTMSAGSEHVIPGPYPYPQAKKPPYCTLTTVANASGAVTAAYNFWKGSFVVSAGTALRVQRPDQQNDTVSEGIAYGMLMAAYIGDRPTFDGLWAYAKQHATGAGLMNWHINADGTIPMGGTGSATDADEDMAWALLVAYAQWGAISYFDEAKRVANAIMSNCVGPDGMLKPGDSWGGSDRTYPDYFAPSYFRVFRKITNNPNWDAVIRRNYEILAAVSGEHGLVPDYTTASYDLSQPYKYDACRTPWRIGLDYCYYGAPEAKAYLDKIGAFFDAQGVSNIGDGYSLTGTKTSSFGNMAFIGPAGVAGMAGFPKLLDDAFTYGATGNGGTTAYYQQSLRVITMLVMSGNYIDVTQP
jgi:endo-1,4-beta-D-glucanase Y